MQEPKYQKLADALRAAVCGGVYPAGERLPSENELVARTGYSRQTVRQAMALLESEGLTVRVRGSGTYVRSGPAQRELTHNIAVVTTYIGEYIFPNILQGIQGVLAQNGYTPLLSATGNRLSEERRILSELLDKPIDGLIVEGTKTALPNPNVDLYRRFALRGIPVVFINGYYPDVDDPVYVVADDRRGGRLACELLLRRGHRRIAGIFKSDDMQGHRRYAGYAEALVDAKLPVDDDAILWYATENREALFDARLPDALRGCTAAVCYNDEAAVSLLARLRDGQAPEIVSFDHSLLAQMSPFLSLAGPKERLGALAAQKLLNILQGRVEHPAVLPWEMPPECAKDMGK